MSHPSRRHPALVVALYVNAALLAGILVTLLARGSDRLPTLVSAAMAQETGTPVGSPMQQNIGAAANLVIVPGQFSERTYGCYLMDVDAQTLCAYQYSPGEHQLKLVAARSFRYDHKLTNYNTDPDPEEIRRLLDQQKAGIRGTTPPGGAAGQ